MYLNILIAISIGVVGYLSMLYFNAPPQNPKTIEASQIIAPPKTGDQIPTFEFTDQKGEPYKISNFKGKTILLNFWASWCAPCIKEFPLLINAAKQNPDTLILIALSNDINEEKMNAFIKKMEQTNPDINLPNIVIAHDDGGAITNTLFQTFRLPETYIIGYDQKIIHKLIGANWNENDLNTYINTP